MNPFIWQAPTKYVFGEGAVEVVGQQLAESGWTNVLVVYGQGSVVRTGVLDRVRSSLEEASVAFRELAGVRPNPEVGLVREGIELWENFEKNNTAGGGHDGSDESEDG